MIRRSMSQRCHTNLYLVYSFINDTHTIILEMQTRYLTLGEECQSGREQERNEKGRKGRKGRRQNEEREQKKGVRKGHDSKGVPPRFHTRFTPLGTNLIIVDILSNWLCKEVGSYDAKFKKITQ